MSNIYLSILYILYIQIYMYMYIYSITQNVTRELVQGKIAPEGKVTQ